MASLRSMLTTMVVVLPAFWTMGQLARWWTPPLVAVIMAVMLGLSLPRTLDAMAGADRLWASVALVLAVVVASLASIGLAAGGWWRVIGGLGFAVLAGMTTWVRRFHGPWKAIGLIIGVALIAALVSPMSASISWKLVLWLIVAALCALAWALAMSWLAGGTPTDTPETSQAETNHRMTSSTKMAIQGAAAIAVAAGAAQLVDQRHLVWPILTAFIVLNNNRGRGDVLLKGTQRLVGALIGTAVATLLVGLWPAGDARSVIVIFVLIAVASALRPFGYVYWAACVTAGLAFLYSFLGQGGIDLLARRLLGILIGGVIAIAITWVLLPVKTTDVVRLRIGAVRRASAILAAQGDGPKPAQIAALREAVHQLSAMLPTVRAARVLGVGPARALAPIVDETLALASGALEPASANNLTPDP